VIEESKQKSQQSHENKCLIKSVHQGELAEKTLDEEA